MSNQLQKLRLSNCNPVPLDENRLLSMIVHGEERQKLPSRQVVDERRLSRGDVGDLEGVGITVQIEAKGGAVIPAINLTCCSALGPALTRVAVPTARIAIVSTLGHCIRSDQSHHAAIPSAILAHNQPLVFPGLHSRFPCYGLPACTFRMTGRVMGVAESYFWVTMIWVTGNLATRDAQGICHLGAVDENFEDIVAIHMGNETHAIASIAVFRNPEVQIWPRISWILLHLATIWSPPLRNSLPRESQVLTTKVTPSLQSHLLSLPPSLTMWPAKTLSVTTAPILSSEF